MSGRAAVPGSKEEAIGLPVSVRRVESYDDEALYRAVCAHFEALGVAAELAPDARVLLKPNLLVGSAPQKAVTTHPAVLRAVARWLGERGVTRITLADSPGGTYTPGALRRAYAASGYDALTDVLALNQDTSSEPKDGFTLIRPVLESDYIINCCKLKTHGLTVMTGAVKNLFGCIPGLKKPEVHCLKPTADSFADYLLDLALCVKPQVSLMDAVDCMEGNGPGGGRPRRAGYTLASRSPFELDEAAARLMGMKPAMSPVIRRARERGLCAADAVSLAGDALVPADPPFVLPDSVLKGEPFLSANGLFHRVCGRRTSFPAVDAAKCVGCGRCAESCPKKLIRVAEGKAVFTRRGCISCFCCQEMCPAHAIGVRNK